MGNLIHRGKGSFTHVENTIFYERGLSAKAKGVYCQIRSLESNPEWVFSIAGFAMLFKDGIDSIKSSLKELERFGFLLRARMRGKDGRFVSAEESLWVTLDDPSLYEDAARELAEQGYAIVSKRDEGASKKGESDRKGSENAQLITRSGFSTCGEPTSGQTTSGEATCGESAAINPSGDQVLIESKNPSLALPIEETCEQMPVHRRKRKAFPQEFEDLCAISLKPVKALAFKEDCLKAWEARIQEGYTPEQIIGAYETYAHAYERRNGVDASMAKNLARWLSCEGGLEDYADDPERCLMTCEDGSPLPMQQLAERHKRFGRLWRKAKGRRGLVTSELNSRMRGFTEDDLKIALAEDRQYCDFMDACRIAYDQYLIVVDPMNDYGLRSQESPLFGTTLLECMDRKGRIRKLAAGDGEFADLLDRYESLSRDITECRLIGQLDDKAWEMKRREELQLLHEIEDRLKAERVPVDA